MTVVKPLTAGDLLIEISNLVRVLRCASIALWRITILVRHIPISVLEPKTLS